MAKRIDISGQRFGRLVAIEPLLPKLPEHGPVLRWRCRCDCGGESCARGTELRSGHTRSCGCLERENLARGTRTKHGHSRRSGHTPEFRAWHHMLARCHTPTNHKYPLYGARGIAVCAGWRGDYRAFLADMGERPTSGHSIDRIDNNRGYDCGKCADCVARAAVANCRWATKREQASNTRRNKLITINGETLCVSEWGRRYGVGGPVIHARIKRGMAPAVAVTTPVHRQFGRRVA